MRDGLTLREESDAAPAADAEWLYARMTQYNAEASGGIDFRNLAIFLRDEHGKAVAGLLGWTVWAWLHIDSLWVPLELRGRGHGARLLAAAEDAARARGCTLVEVDTFTFQARGFYERAGYSVFGTLSGIGHGRFERFYLRKSLAS